MYVIADKRTRRPLRTATRQEVSPNEFAVPISREEYVLLVNDPFALANYVVKEVNDGASLQLRPAPKVKKGIQVLARTLSPDVLFSMNHTGVQMLVDDASEFPLDAHLVLSILEDGSPLSPIAHGLSIRHRQTIPFSLVHTVALSSKPLHAFKLQLTDPFEGFRYGVKYG